MGPLVTFHPEHGRGVSCRALLRGLDLQMNATGRPRWVPLARGRRGGQVISGCMRCLSNLSSIRSFCAPSNREASRSSEPGSLDSESKELTVTQQNQLGLLPAAPSCARASPREGRGGVVLDALRSGASSSSSSSSSSSPLLLHLLHLSFPPPFLRKAAGIGGSRCEGMGRMRRTMTCTRISILLPFHASPLPSHFGPRPPPSRRERERREDEGLEALEPLIL